MKKWGFTFTRAKFAAEVPIALGDVGFGEEREAGEEGFGLAGVGGDRAVGEVAGGPWGWSVPVKFGREQGTHSCVQHRWPG